MYYNRTAKDLNVLKPGDTVTIKPEGLTKGQKWRKGLIVQNHPFRSYDVEVDGRRNRVHLKPAGKPPNLEKTQSGPNPKADDKVRASETKKSSSNAVPSSTKLKSKINFVRDTPTLSDIHRCCIAYIAFLNHSCVTVCN